MEEIADAIPDLARQKRNVSGVKRLAVLHHAARAFVGTRPVASHSTSVPELGERRSPLVSQSGLAHWRAFCFQCSHSRRNATCWPDSVNKQ